MTTTIGRFLFPATDHEVTYEKRSLLGTGWFSFWWEAKSERWGTDLHIHTQTEAGKIFINGEEYLPASEKHHE